MCRPLVESVSTRDYPPYNAGSGNLGFHPRLSARFPPAMQSSRHTPCAVLLLNRFPPEITHHELYGRVSVPARCLTGQGMAGTETPPYNAGSGYRGFHPRLSARFPPAMQSSRHTPCAVLLLNRFPPEITHHELMGRVSVPALCLTGQGIAGHRDPVLQ